MDSKNQENQNKCPVCSELISNHTKLNIIQCALNEIKRNCT